eukprot:3258988-Pleurochrysis_carterae.AAC.1
MNDAGVAEFGQWDTGSPASRLMNVPWAYWHHIPCLFTNILPLLTLNYDNTALGSNAGICLERPSGADGKMSIGTNTDRHWSGSRRRRGGWAHLRSGSRNQALSGQGQPSRAEFRELTWGAERERSASMHAMRLQNGEAWLHVSVDCK